MALTRDQILAARRNRKPHRFEVPEWGGDVFIRVLSAEDQLAYDGVEAKEVPGRVLIDSLCDENGERLFTDEDYAELIKEDFPVIMRVFAEAAHLNGLSTKELDEAMSAFEQAPDAARSTV